MADGIGLQLLHAGNVARVVLFAIRYALVV